MAKKPMVSISLNDIELKKLLGRIERMRPAVQKKYMRRGVTKGARLVASVAKTKVPVASGTLKRSIGSRVKTKGMDVIGVAGPRANMGRITAKKITGKANRGKRRAGKSAIAKAANVQIQVPTRYAHLIEFGPKGTRKWKFHPFMRPAWDEAGGQVLGTLREELRKAVADFNRKKV